VCCETFFYFKREEGREKESRERDLRERRKREGKTRSERRCVFSLSLSLSESLCEREEESRGQRFLLFSSNDQRGEMKGRKNLRERERVRGEISFSFSLFPREREKGMREKKEMRHQQRQEREVWEFLYFYESR